MYSNINKLIIIIFIVFPSDTFSENLSTADSHAPISVHGDHMHKKNGLMFSYRFANMRMNKVFNGTKSISTNAIMTAPNGASGGEGNYMNAPVSMKMDMHMLGAMFAPTDYLTIMLMTNYSQKEMTQQRVAMSGGGSFDVNSSGFGDVRLSGLIKLINNDKIKSHIGIGLSMPSGSINQRDNTPASNNTRLGYAMQNGSGTYDPFFSLTNLNNFGNFKFGQQIFFKLPASGKNSNNYKYGKTFDSSLWTSYSWVNSISTSLRLNYNFMSEISGSDDEMNKRMSPAMDSNNQGHQKLNVGVGLNFINHKVLLNNHRLALESIFPLYQKYQGLQMSENFKIVIGWQYGF